MVERKSPMQPCSRVSIGWGWSDMVYLSAVTTVLRTNIDSDLRFSLSLGRRVWGSTRVSLPRHSATTFLVPSSGLSKCWKRTPLHDMIITM